MMKLLKRKGTILIQTIIAVMILGLIGPLTAKFLGALYSTQIKTNDLLLSRQYAIDGAELARATEYKNLDGIVTKEKENIGNGLFRMITVGDSETDSVGNVFRSVNVNIYDSNAADSKPVSTIKLRRYVKAAALYSMLGDAEDGAMSQKATTEALREGDLKTKTETITEIKEYIEEKLGNVSGVPVGSIVAWSNNSPMSDEKGNWLECNGQSFSSDVYPKLASLLGSNKVPDLRNRFLEGFDSAGSYKEPGLPEISGSISELGHISNVQYGLELNGTGFSGAFSLDRGYTHYTIVPRYRHRNYGDVREDNNLLPDTTHTYVPGQLRANNSGDPAYGNTFGYPKMDFYASRFNGIYGASETVQPKSFTVRYYIKAAGGSNADASSGLSALVTGSGITDASKTGNGYIRFANGMIMQWGNHSVTKQVFNFPIPFPNTCLVFVCSNTTKQGGAVDDIFGYAVSNTQYYMASKQSSVDPSIGGVSGYPGSWIAIGF